VQLAELQESYLATRQELAEVRGKIIAVKNERKRSAITLGEVEKIPNSTRLYRSVGEGKAKAERSIKGRW
jgi:chaperonin cofactor prefoldin